MAAWRKQATAFAMCAAALAASLGVAAYLRFVFAGPRPQAYMTRQGVGLTFVPAGQLQYDGERFACGHVPTVINNRFSDYGAAYFGFILINHDRFTLLPLSVKRFAYGHECGHQYVGYSELDADCYAVKLGLREGWLTPQALNEVCAFFSKSKGTALHLPGPRRCAAIVACYEKQGGRASSYSDAQTRLEGQRESP